MKNQPKKLVKPPNLAKQILSPRCSKLASINIQTSKTPTTAAPTTFRSRNYISSRKLSTIQFPSPPSDRLEQLCKEITRKSRFKSVKISPLIEEYLEELKYERPVNQHKFYDEDMVANPYYQQPMEETENLQLPPTSPFQQRMEEINKEKNKKEGIRDFYSLVRKNVIQRSTKRNSNIYEQFTNIEDIANKLDPLIMRWAKEMNMASDKFILDMTNIETEWAGFQMMMTKEEIKNYVKANKQKLASRNTLIYYLNKENPQLSWFNIPKLMKQYNFSRYEVHNMYILYKSLQMITSQMVKNYNFKDGFDFETFRMGIPQIFIQSYELAQDIFNIIDINYSGFLSWNEFMDLMSTIRAKTIIEKVDLFIKVADADQSGTLSMNEIHHLCKISLKSQKIFLKYFQISFMSSCREEDIESLSAYFTKHIFEILQVDQEDEVKFEQIKTCITEEKEGWELLCLFCGADS